MVNQCSIYFCCRINGNILKILILVLSHNHTLHQPNLRFFIFLITSFLFIIRLITDQHFWFRIICLLFILSLLQCDALPNLRSSKLTYSSSFLHLDLYVLEDFLLVFTVLNYFFFYSWSSSTKRLSVIFKNEFHLLAKFSDITQMPGLFIMRIPTGIIRSYKSMFITLLNYSFLTPCIVMRKKFQYSLLLMFEIKCQLLSF